MNTLDSKLHSLFETHKRLQKALHQAEKGLTAADPQDDESRDRFRQLVLQLRLDNEDTIRALILLHNNYCMALGIDPMNSEMVNLERLQYSLGDENVTLELTWLHDLIDKLEQTFALGDKLRRAEERKRKQLRKLLAKFPEFHESLALEAKLDRSEWEAELTRSHEGVEHELRSALELETQFQFSIEQLTEAFQEYSSLPKFGEIHDYLAGLQGPISRFFQAYQNGLSVIDKLAHLVTLKKTHSNELTDVKQQIAELTLRLEQMQKQQKASLQKTMNQQQHLQELLNRPTPEYDPELTNRMQLRRTLRMFP